MCSITPPARLNVRIDLASARLARDFLRQAKCDAHQARVLDRAELLTTELVTNAVRHGGPPIVVEVTCEGTAGMTVEVCDGSDEEPVLKDAAPLDESGRGVLLVDLLSDEWGVDQRPGDGKAVWFTLRSHSQ